ncbi:tetratricopeptide repeat protein (macronuclear) [Tetrahymena thermophila SB210]|uniref:Tetratricopeptide repeat protein n=1 Tax=Tetrahymena thermophila (strain SB210) TaxID=312017 RepID=Q23XH5_TETTS|nr:tetratricopeptide repeat protein [Tetrahymena thermophila SB210]EAS01232.2 tetratricopeptide repeat protein [Tetrahymena thermophila SB210]|eukprot:XP_001021477.2 tetratricopeptide repeat protein [Tetrahymena thermophila SB210]
MEQQESIFNKIEDFLKANSKTLIHVNFELYEHINCDQDIVQISSKFAECTEIKTLNLDIACWHVQDDQIKLLFGDLPGFKNMDNLKLNLSYNRISLSGVQILGVFFKKCTMLKQLLIDFYGNKIDSKLASQLVEVISQVKSIQQLELLFGKNKIKDEETLTFCNSLQSLGNQLISLNIRLSENKISDEGAIGLGQALSEFKKLIYLDLQLQENKIGNQGVSSIARGLSKSTQIKILALILHQNEIGNDGAQSIGEALKNLKSLTKLELWLKGNKIDDIGILSIANSLSICTHLESLQLSLYDNYISDEGYLKFNEYLNMMPSLLNLEFSFSQSEKLLKSRDILNCKNIKVLTLNIYECKTKREKIEHKTKALKIKRLVQLNINDY